MAFEFDPVPHDPSPPRRPRRRALAVLGAAILVAGAGGVGFGIGRSAGGDEVSVGPGAEAGVGSTPSTEPPAAPATMPAIEPDAEPIESEAIETMSEDGLDESTSSASATVVSGGSGWTIFGGEPMELIAERTTSSGVVLRAHLGQLWDHGFSEYEDFGGPTGWQPPAWCFESGQVRIALGGGEATGTSVIDVGSVSWWTEPFEGRAVSALTMGTADGNPHRVVFVQAPPAVTNVSVTFGDGASDSVSPTNGIALLAVPGADIITDEADGAWIGAPVDFDVTFDAGEGAEPTTIDGTRTGYNDPEFQQSCSPPPPELPAPGEQPADADAAEAAITELMTLIYGDDDGDNDERIDDPTGVAEARDQIREGGFEEAAASAEAIVEELVFTSPTEAWFRYRIETTSGTFSERFGIAAFIDDPWKITRNTICQDLSMAGGDCGGFIENIRPPAG